MPGTSKTFYEQEIKVTPLAFISIHTYLVSQGKSLYWILGDSWSENSFELTCICFICQEFALVVLKKFGICLYRLKIFAIRSTILKRNTINTHLEVIRSTINTLLKFEIKRVGGIIYYVTQEQAHIKLKITPRLIVKICGTVEL